MVLSPIFYTKLFVTWKCLSSDSSLNFIIFFKNGLLKKSTAYIYIKGLIINLLHRNLTISHATFYFKWLFLRNY